MMHGQPDIKINMSRLQQKIYRLTHWSRCIRSWPISYTGVHVGPIGRPRCAERVVILHTLGIPRRRQF